MPLIIYDPRADKNRRGKVAKPMALNTDIAPTILGYAGGKLPGHYQGRSLRPIMSGDKPKDWRRDTFCEHLMENATIPKWEGVRSRRYVYARYFQQKPQYEYLHDLTEDPDQLKNLADDPEYAKVLKRMRKRCDELRDEYGGEYDPSSLPSMSPNSSENVAEAQAKRKAAQQKRSSRNSLLLRK